MFNNKREEEKENIHAQEIQTLTANIKNLEKLCIDLNKQIEEKDCEIKNLEKGLALHRKDKENIIIQANELIVNKNKQIIELQESLIELQNKYINAADKAVL